jgi:G3E family GTPase
MADPARLTHILDGGTAGLHPSAAYILRKQIEEADIVVIGKTDLLTSSDIEALEARVVRAYPGVTVSAVSAKTGDGLDTWLGELQRHAAVGQRLADVDYDVYAEGEAVLGWLNATVTLRGEPPTVLPSLT